MKHLMLLFCTLMAAGALRAQCPGCTPVNCAAQNPDGGLCDTILIGMANHPMDEQISFYMPTEIYTTLLPGGGYVQLDRIEITSVVGLPLGLGWESNHSPANEYFPQTGDSVGCVRVCGTPIQADTFRLTVYLLADVTAPVVGQVKNNSQTYNNAVVIVLPDTSGGVASFAVTPPVYSSCDPLTLSFAANITSATNPVDYTWDFGNGNTGTGPTPGSQTYSDAGGYAVSLTTTISEYVIRRVRVTQVNGNWTGDIEELTSFLNSPDLYFTIPSLGYTSSEKTNTGTPATWSNLSIHIPVGTTEFELRVYDKDNGPPLGSQDDSLGSAIINVATGTFLWNDRNGTVTDGDIIMEDTTGTVFSETLDITIGVKPTPVLTLMASDSICGGDTAVIALSGSGILQYGWFKDSVFLSAAQDTFLPATATGTYWVEATSASGCNAVAEPLDVTVLPSPPAPVVNFNGADKVYASNALNNAIQWFLNGDEIPGANSYILTVTDTGMYSVEYSNASGCRSLSDELSVTNIISGLGEIPGVIVSIFPNPCRGAFRLMLSETGSGAEVSITDIAGREVYHIRGSSAGGLIADVNLANEPSGVYLCRISTERGLTVEKILILK